MQHLKYLCEKAIRLPAKDPLPHTPYLDGLKKAATLLKLTERDARFEIAAYAKRNTLCHCSVEDMIDNADWEKLAEQIFRDKQKLIETWGDNSELVLQYRLAVGRFEDKWFEHTSYIDHGGRLRYLINDKAQQKSRRVYKANQKKEDWFFLGFVVPFVQISASGAISPGFFGRTVRLRIVAML